MTFHNVLPKEQQWTHLLGKELNIPNIINDGLGCGSNPRILRTTFDYLSCQTDISNTLVIIQLTNPFRFEFNEGPNFWGRCNNNSCVAHDVNYGKKFTAVKSRYYTTEAEFNEFFQQVLAIECMLKSFNIKKYFFIHYNGDEEFKTINNQSKRFLDKSISWASSLNMSESSIFKSNFEKISNTDHHPGIRGNEQVKDWLLNLIKHRL